VIQESGTSSLGPLLKILTDGNQDVVWVFGLFWLTAAWLNSIPYRSGAEVPVFLLTASMVFSAHRGYLPPPVCHMALSTTWQFAFSKPAGEYLGKKFPQTSKVC